MANPFPQLRMHPSSGLSFPWAEYHPDPVIGSFSAALGPDGVVVGMKMLIYWHNLNEAIKELLGYSWRDDRSPATPRGTPWLRRKLPWQHPIWNQLFVKRIAEVKGIRLEGTGGFSTLTTAPGTVTLTTLPAEKLTSLPGSGVGAGYTPNTGPWSRFHLAELTIQFWRPPYYLRTDQDILDTANPPNPREWLRYVSKTWEMNTEMLTRNNNTFQWLPALKHPNSGPDFTDAVGQVITHYRVSRTWYEIPERALFNSLVDRTPNGLPDNMIYTRTPTENPLSKFDRAAGTSTTCPTPSALLAAAGYTYPSGSPIGGCVNAPIGGRAMDSVGNWVDNTTASRFFGCYAGTLRFDGVTFEPQPLQLPGYLMDIPLLDNQTNELISQQQYNVTFHFDLFDPPPGIVCTPQPAIRGHNLFPYSGNGLWYPILSKLGATTSTGAKLTPFHYADFSDLFYIL